MKVFGYILAIPGSLLLLAGLFILLMAQLASGRPLQPEELASVNRMQALSNDVIIVGGFFAFLGFYMVFRKPKARPDESSPSPAA